MKYFLGRLRSVSLVALFGLASLALPFTPLLSSTASAASSFDDVQISDNYTVTSSSCSGTYSSVDVKETYMDILEIVAPELAVAIVSGDYDTTVYTQTIAGKKTIGFLASRIPSASPTTHGEYTFDVANANVSSGVNYMYVDTGFTSGDYLVGTIGISNSCDSIVLVASGWIEPNYPNGWAIPVFKTTSGADRAQLLFSTATFVPPSGYAGDIPPTSSISKEQKAPSVSYNINNKSLLAKFDGGFNCFEISDSDHNCIPFNITWTVFNDDNELIHSSVQEPEVQFNYEFDELGAYSVWASYTAKGVPFQNLPDRYEYIHSTFLFDIDGENYGGDNSACEILEGRYACVSQLSCAAQPNFFGQLKCKFDNQLTVGIINPSLGAFIGLLKSFVVPLEPTCGLPLTDVAIIPGEVFPMSSLGDSICNNAETVRNEFPLFPAIVNFALAFTLIVIIVRIFNRITNPAKNDIIEGI